MNTPAVEKRCRIRLADVICPDRAQVLQQLTPDLEVEGEVVFLSDHGQEPERFAIVEVKGVLSPLIVPIEHVKFAARPVEETAGSQGKMAGQVAGAD